MPRFIKAIKKVNQDLTPDLSQRWRGPKIFKQCGVCTQILVFNV